MAQSSQSVEPPRNPGRFKDLATGVAEGQWVSGNLTFGVSAVPEPGGLLLAVLGLGVLVPRLRRASRD